MSNPIEKQGDFSYVPGRFIKQPVTISAMYFDGTDECGSAVIRWANQGDIVATRMESEWVLSIPTLEGTMYASKGDWVIRGVQGEFYPCKDSIFQTTYREAHTP